MVYQIAKQEADRQERRSNHYQGFNAKITFSSLSHDLSKQYGLELWQFLTLELWHQDIFFYPIYIIDRR